MKKILLCSDLDRTLIPNGKQPESAQARPLLSKLAEHRQLRLAYVSGRDNKLIRQAINDYDLPVPEFVIGDVGTTLYHIQEGTWLLNEAWHRVIGEDWHGHGHHDIVKLLDSMDTGDLQLQPDSKQNTYKVSYYTNPAVDSRQLKSDVSRRLEDNNISAHVIWSLDEAEHRGLLDILPRKANKLAAIRFLMALEGVAESDTVFAGDSGNDLDVLVSGLQAILVKNAAEDVRYEALEQLQAKEQTSQLYLAQGGLLAMNGNYAAGVIEGLLHFYPEARIWLESPGSHVSRSR